MNKIQTIKIIFSNTIFRSKNTALVKRTHLEISLQIWQNYTFWAYIHSICIPNNISLNQTPGSKTATSLLLGTNVSWVPSDLNRSYGAQTCRQVDGTTHFSTYFQNQNIARNLRCLSCQVWKLKCILHMGKSISESLTLLYIYP